MIIRSSLLFFNYIFTDQSFYFLMKLTLYLFMRQFTFGFMLLTTNLIESVNRISIFSYLQLHSYLNLSSFVNIVIIFSIS